MVYSATTDCLSKLPNETIYQILDDVDPDDLVNLCLASKRIHQCAGKRLQHHRVMVAKYERLSIDNKTNHVNGLTHPLDFVHDLVTNPGNQLYVKHLSIAEYGCSSRSDLTYDPNHHLSDNEVRAVMISNELFQFQHLFNELRTIYKDGIYSPNHEMVKLALSVVRAKPSSIVALMFFVMPRLKQLSLSCNDWAAGRSSAFFNDMPTAWFMHPAAFERCFPNLSEVTISGGVLKRRSSVEIIRLLFFFAHLPTMRSLRGYNLPQYNYQAGPWNPLKCKDSHVIPLELASSDLDQASLSYLLVDMISIKTVVYESAKREVSSTNDVDDLIEALQNHSSHSIENLTITICPESKLDSMLGDVFDGPCLPLTNLQGLKRVRIDAHLYWSLYRQHECNLLYLEEEPQVPLFEVFPSGIEDITFDGNITPRGVCVLLHDLENIKHFELTQLSNITFSDVCFSSNNYEADYIDKYEDICREAEVELVIKTQQNAAVGQLFG